MSANGPSDRQDVDVPSTVGPVEGPGRVGDGSQPGSPGAPVELVDVLGLCVAAALRLLEGAYDAAGNPFMDCRYPEMHDIRALRAARLKYEEWRREQAGQPSQDPLVRLHEASRELARRQGALIEVRQRVRRHVEERLDGNGTDLGDGRE